VTLKRSPASERQTAATRLCGAVVAFGSNRLGSDAAGPWRPASGRRTGMRIRHVAATAAFVAALGTLAMAHAEEKVLRFIPEADLRSIDPIWTTAYITRNHGYMVYDTLFAIDHEFKPKPQMVEKWSVSDDQLKWTFTL